MPRTKKMAVDVPQKNVNVSTGDAQIEQMIERVKMMRAEKDALKEEARKKEPPSVSAGPIEKFADLLFNPSDDKLLELTDFDLNQTRLIPQLMTIDIVWDYMEEISVYRVSPELYKEIYGRDIPVLGNLTGTYVHRLAQVRRSKNGATAKAGVDLCLAELESRAEPSLDELGGTDEP